MLWVLTIYMTNKCNFVDCQDIMTCLLHTVKITKIKEDWWTSSESMLKLGICLSVFIAMYTLRHDRDGFIKLDNVLILDV